MWVLDITKEGLTHCVHLTIDFRSSIFGSGVIMPSIRDLRNAKRRQSFTGRKVEQSTFRQLLLAEEP
jgi:hypothetical protein